MNCQEIQLTEVIKDIAAGPFGSNLKVSCFVNEGFPIVDGANLKRFKVTDNITKFVTEEKARSLHRSIAKRGDVVVTISGTLGQIAYIPNDSKYEEYLCSQRQFRVTFDTTKVYVPYLVFYFHTYEGQHKILSFANQVGVPALSQPLKNFRQITVQLPDIKTQKKIANIVEVLNGKIEENENINNNLEQQYISIVDNLLSKLTQYKIYSLLEVADCQNGRAFYKEGYDPNGAFVIDLGNVNTSGNFVRTAADKYISLDRYKEPKLEKYRVYKNDIVMVMTDRKSTMELLGKVGKIYKDGYYLLNQRMYRIRAKKGINTNYLYACLNSTETSNFLKRKALGSVQKYVNTGEINSIEIKVPSSEKMEEIASILDPIFSQMESNILENESLNELRDILLPKLMSGEIDVSDIEL